jgi:hypothetical protein
MSARIQWSSLSVCVQDEGSVQVEDFHSPDVLADLVVSVPWSGFCRLSVAQEKYPDRIHAGRAGSNRTGMNQTGNRDSDNACGGPSGTCP